MELWVVFPRILKVDRDGEPTLDRGDAVSEMHSQGRRISHCMIPRHPEKTRTGCRARTMGKGTDRGDMGRDTRPNRRITKVHGISHSILLLVINDQVVPALKV